MKKDNESRILNQIFKFNDLTDNLMLKKIINNNEFSTFLLLPSQKDKISFI